MSDAYGRLQPYLEFLGIFSNFRKIRLVRAALVFSDRQTEEETDRHDDMIGVPRSYANAPENEQTRFATMPHSEENNII